MALVFTDMHLRIHSTHYTVPVIHRAVCYDLLLSSVMSQSVLRTGHEVGVLILELSVIMTSSCCCETLFVLILQFLFYFYFGI